MASAAAAEARRTAASTIGYYNLKLGPSAWRFGTGLGVDFDDNVNLTEHKDGDLIFRPQINTEMLWPVTDKNSINLKLGAGYAAYVEHSNLDHLYITPGSELSFDVYVGDFWINFHDRFSINENAYQDPSVSGTGDYSQLENAIGVAGLWDLNKVIVRAGYDHVNYVGLWGSSGHPDGSSELFSTSAGYAIQPGMLLGVEVGAGLINYTGTNTFSDAFQWSVGSFFDSDISQYMHLRASAGYSVYTPDSSGTVGASEEFSGVYAQIDVSHRLNQYVDYTLSGGRTINFAFFGGTVDLYFARLQANWKFLQKINFGTSLVFEHGTELRAGGETFDRYGAGLTLGRTLMKKLTGNLGYQFYWRASDLPGRDYTVNIVSLNLNYAF